MGKQLIFERAVHTNEAGEAESYWPERFPLEFLIDEWAASRVGGSSAIFSVNYMNDPSGLEGNILKTAWLHPYTEDELVASRASYKVDRGYIHIGIDPAFGGQNHDADFTALMAMEVVGNRGFLIDYIALRINVDKQAQFIEDWITQLRPTLVKLEDNSSKGFIATALLTQVNNQQGTKWPVEIKKPGVHGAQGKHIRFLSMAARFEQQQVRVPGFMNAAGDLIIDPKWDKFVNQWKGFPSGHDDILDATAWCIEDAFMGGEVAVVSMSPDGHKQSLHGEGGRAEFEPDTRRRWDHPIGARRSRRSVRFWT